MLRRISTKWVLTVLAAVIVPFLGFAWYVNTQMAERQWTTVRYYLLSIAGEMGSRIDNEVRWRREQLELLTSATPLTEWAVGDYAEKERTYFLPMLRNAFDRFVEDSRAFDLIVAVDARGELAVASRRGEPGQDPTPYDEALAGHRFDQETWFQEAMRGEVGLVDHHVSPLVPPRASTAHPHPENYHIGFAIPVRDQLEPERVVGVVYGLIDWSYIQNHVLRTIRPLERDSEVPDIYQSSYAWLWASDCDTIIAHPTAELYTRRVSQPPVNLPELAAAARSGDWGMYPEYVFRGVKKSAAYKHCAGRDQGGFGWVVGIGIDNDNIYATVAELERVQWQVTLFALGVVVFGTVLIARRTTRPILALQQHTRRIAGGDLDARVEVRSRDELGELAQSFNAMAHELSESRAKLIKAEKDAAWREMARQVAHEIKNPLTPIQLSASLLKRAHDERSPDFEAIFDRTIDLVQRQVENMRAIASDFSAFAGARKPEPEVVDLDLAIGEVLTLEAAWAAELGVEIVRREGGVRVFVDPGDLRRVLINLVSNALEAMSDGGRLEISVRRVEGAENAAGAGRAEVEIEIRDTGVGLSDEVRARLFEPYFTTRSHGTGLGLAIAARLVDEMNGAIELVPVPDGPGTIARVRLPEHRA